MRLSTSRFDHDRTANYFCFVFFVTAVNGTSQMFVCCRPVVQHESKKIHKVEAGEIPQLAQCRAVSGAHISASYLSYLHQSTVVTAALWPKQDRLASPPSVSTLLFSQLYQQGPTGLTVATLSGHFSTLCPSATTPCWLFVTLYASQCRASVEWCIPVMQHNAQGHTLGRWQFLFSVFTHFLSALQWSLSVCSTIRSFVLYKPQGDKRGFACEHRAVTCHCIWPKTSLNSPRNICKMNSTIVSMVQKGKVFLYFWLCLLGYSEWTCVGMCGSGSHVLKGCDTSPSLEASTPNQVLTPLFEFLSPSKHAGRPTASI